MQIAIIELIIGICILLGSPGPMPIALAATSSAYGIKQAFPFYSGNLVGIVLVILLTGIGLAAMFAAYPALKVIMLFAGAAYIVYLAIKLSVSEFTESNELKLNAAPSFKDGFVLSLINPKAYAAFLAIFSNYILPFDSSYLAVFTTALICILVVAVIDFLWLGFGGIISPLIKSAVYAKYIKLTFSVLMIASVTWILVPAILLEVL